MANEEGFEAVSNRFCLFLEVAISNSYWGYTGLLRYQLGYLPVIIVLSTKRRCAALRKDVVLSGHTRHKILGILRSSKL
jgi:hypothetical protein